MAWESSSESPAKKARPVKEEAMEEAKNAEVG
jgi:hypothetical protein